MLPVKKILCSTDFSEPSIAALRAACELAERFDAELKLLHVISLTPPLSGDMMAFSVSRYLPSIEERRAQAQRQIASLIEENVPKNVRTVTEVRIGDAPDNITNAAVNDDTDLIVIGTHGETGWRYLAIGSVAAKVVRMAQRPVLTIYGGPKSEDAETLAA